MQETYANYYATRDITPEECPWIDVTYRKGFVFTKYVGHTFGCLTDLGIAVVTPGKTSFMEVPYSAVMIVEDGIQTEEVVEDNVVNTYVIEETIPTK